MKRGITSALVALPAFLWLASAATGEDWPQWMGPTRNGHVTSFTPPKAWPKDLTKKWQVKMGDGKVVGISTPALVGDRLYVFAREGGVGAGSEVTRCLNAADGKEVWSDKYDADFSGKGDTMYPGPRSSVAVGDGMVVTVGVNGVVSCLTTDGKKVWRHDKGRPTFHTACSPLIVDKLAVVQVGDDNTGSVVAYDLANGNEKWKWGNEGTGYASPNLMTVDGTKMVVALTSQNLVGIGLADGKLLWKTPFAAPKGPGSYNASTPTVEGTTVVFAGSGGRGTKAVKVEKSGDSFAVKDLWANKDYSVIYNTPVVHGKTVYGLTGPRNTLYALNLDTGAKAWDYDLPVAGAKGGKGGGGGYGSIVDAGAVMMLLTPAGKLTVFEPSDKEYKELASYPVGTQTYAYPIVSGNRIIIKDADSVTLYTVE